MTGVPPLSFRHAVEFKMAGGGTEAIDELVPASKSRIEFHDGRALFERVESDEPRSMKRTSSCARLASAASSPWKLFIADLARFTEEAADRIKADHASFRDNHARGAFDSIDMVHR